MTTDKWADTRQKGMWHYVLFRGVLSWGVTSGALFAVFAWAFLDDFNFLNLWLWPVMGIFWGLTTWWFAERNYQRNQNKGV